MAYAKKYKALFVTLAGAAAFAAYYKYLRPKHAERVRAGELSPLAYHMARRQMDPGMLAGYTGLFKFQVWRHMKPAAFRRISPTHANRYAAIFRITTDELMEMPGCDPAAGARK